MKPQPSEADAGPTALPGALSRSAGYLLNEAATVIREMDEAALRPLGLNPRQLGVLRTIAAEGPLSQLEAGQRNRVDRSTMVKLLDGLEGQGFIARGADPADRRRHVLALTPAGRAVLARALEEMRRTQAAFLAPLDAGEWDALKRTLHKLLAATPGAPANPGAGDGDH